MSNEIKMTRARHAKMPAYQLLGELFVAFTDKPFTKEQAMAVVNKTSKLLLSNLGNWTTRGLIEISPKTHRISAEGVTFQLNDKAIAILEKATIPSNQKPVVQQPTQVINGSKSPDALLRQIKKQLEEQIELIDEALESINQDRTDAMKFRAIADLMKKNA